MTINHNCIGRRISTYDSIIEFGGNLYLVEGGRSSTKCDAGSGDLIENWDEEFSLSNEVVSLIGCDSFYNNLWFRISTNI